MVRSPSGEFLLAFRRAPNRKAFGEEKNNHVDSNRQLMLVRAHDGVSWTPPTLIYAHAIGGSQDPCLLQISDGTLLCLSYGWTFLRPAESRTSSHLSDKTTRALSSPGAIFYARLTAPKRG
ncbi:MAG: hypothetical protein CK538_08495 [Opitutia bacterium]|nr:MAG: hypothetical protein CK538_08495 [Opitutae bacterium]